MKVLVKIAAVITQHPRQIFTWKELQWSTGSITHNAFRVFEYLFGRRDGIRAEMSAVRQPTAEGYVTLYAFHTWESLCAYFEREIRSFFSSEFPISVRVPVQYLRTTNGLSLPVFTSPYLFAVAYKTSSYQEALGVTVTSTTLTSMDVSGTNPCLFVGVFDTGGVINSCTFNGSATGISLVSGSLLTVSGSEAVGIYYGAVSGTANVVVGASGTTVMRIHGTSFSGVSQSGQPDANTRGTSSSTSPWSVSVNTAVSNSWSFLMTRNTAVNLVASTNSTRRASADNTSMSFDSNGTITTGGFSMSVTFAAGTTNGMIASFNPFVSATINSSFFAFM